MSTPATPERTFTEALDLLWRAFLEFLRRIWDSVDHVIIPGLVIALSLYGIYEAFLAPKKGNRRDQ